MSSPLHICIVYDCLFPWTIGGAERWYRALAERLAADGHHVTYLTMRQWEEHDRPAIAGVEVLAVSPRMPLYQDGKRRITPPLRFGLGVFLHLLRHGRRYDVVHLCSFPYFSLLAAGALRRLCGYRIICDWFEIWTHSYWRDYLGRLGWVGWTIQRLCAAIRQHAHVFSRLHEARLRELRPDASIHYMPGLAETPPDGMHLPAREPPTLVYAGRMISEKRVSLLVDAIAIARRTLPDLHAILFGRGPEHAAIQAQVGLLGLTDAVSLPGFVETEVLERAMREALCIVQPSEREGYGLVVVEAAARGIPVVVVRAEDNAAIELVENERNGLVADPTPAGLAKAIITVASAGEAMRRSTRLWYADHAQRLSIESSLRAVADRYGADG